MTRLKELRKARGISQQKLATHLNVARSTVAMWETGASAPDYEALDKIADFFDVTTDYILGRTDDPHVIQESVDFLETVSARVRLTTTKIGIRIPVLGRIPAGIPIEAVEDILDYEEIPDDWGRGGKEYFALKIKGDSMYPKYLEDDVVIFLRADDCDSGAECAVIINGEDATFKKVIKQTNGVMLQPLNSGYEPMYFTFAEVENLPVRVLGIAKEIRRKI